MIVSASRRTDIPAFYSRWFFQRLREGYVLVRNPFNPHTLSKIDLRETECFVFWTKNPAPMLERLGELKGVPFYFQFTLNGYGKDIEPNLPPLEERLRTFQRLSEQIGKERVIWRYDPILLGGNYTLSWHEERFAQIAQALRGRTGRCVISYIDLYSKIKKKMEALGIGEMAAEEKRAAADKLLGIAQNNGITLQTCAEDMDLPGIRHGSCVDPRLISTLLGGEISAGKDGNQRAECGCVSSVDIGAYNTCLHGCAYCYANVGAVGQNYRRHNPRSPLLAGEVAQGDVIRERLLPRVLPGQTSLFD